MILIGVRDTPCETGGSRTTRCGQILVLVVLLTLPVGCSDQDPVSAMMEAEEHARALVPVLWGRKEKFPNDPQMLLGVAILAERYAPSPMYFENNAGLYRRVLDIEPRNRTAMAALARHSVVRFTAGFQKPLISLEMKRQYAERNNLEEVMIPSYSDLYTWFGEEGKKSVMISDFDEARAHIVREQLRELPAVRAVLDEGRQIDPDNALYDYLDAQLDLELGRDAQALSKIEQGSKKAKLARYANEVAAVRRKVLEDAGTPQKYIETIDQTRSPQGPGVSTGKILRLADDQAADGNAEAAADIYELLIRIADQVAEESDRTSVGSRGTRERWLEHLRRKAEDGLSRVSEKGAP